MLHSTFAHERVSVLATLRALLPNRLMHLSEALCVAELQANRLLAIRNTLEAPVSEEIISGLPGVAIDYETDMPASGATDWDSRHRRWVITLRANEPATRQRFTLLHEYKHIIDHGHPGIADLGYHQTRRPPAELVADYFAACVLMPKRLIKSAFFGQTQDPVLLADLFDVSGTAMQLRLSQLGLLELYPTKQRHLLAVSGGAR